MKKSSALAFVVAGLISLDAQASPMTKSTVGTSGVKEALLLPVENRVSALKSYGTKAEAQLTAIMFNNNESMDVRWRAITAAGLLGGRNLEAQVVKALNNREWFVRNAGLVAMEMIDRNQAKQWARKLMNDKALIVRSAAVDTLARLDDQTSASLLWTKLHAKENFRGSQSLWIRKQITMALARIDKAQAHGKFVSLLEDRDESVQDAAVRALELRTGQKLGTEKEPTKFKRAYWQQWWKDREA